MIVSFSNLGNHGRLGNQLFEIAATLGIAERVGAQPSFPEWKYERFFEIDLPHVGLSSSTIKERFFHYQDIQIPAEGGDLYGYFQSEKYFGSARLKLKDEFVQECKSKIDIFQKETICIQIRRGDYVANLNYFQLPVTFYIDALGKYFPNWQDFNILFISDDIEYCKLHFQALPNAYFSEGITDIQDLALGSCCDHFIISNSTFGWWVAWLGEKPGSKIIHSGHLFAGRLSRSDIKDYRPDRWISYKKDQYKIPLKDMTFTMPVLFDHASRKESLDLVTYMLLSSFDTNLIVCEQGGNTFEYSSAWARYIPFESNIFHRTKMLNLMAGEAQTPYIANLDCDILLTPAQIWVAVEQLRGGADMVFPYHGGFARMPRSKWYEPIQKAFDLGVLKGEHFTHMEAEHNSVGGAVFFSLESFIEGGMENEYFISFGPEDCERHDRFKMLGYDIRRVNAPLYHMNHFVGDNSSPRNPYFESNVAEIEKVRSFNRDDLRKYVDTWEWRHPYTARYYNKISEGSIRSAGIVMQALGFHPESVIDIGCGVGEWHNGHPDYIGVDHHVHKDDLLIPPDRFIDCDLNQDFPKLERKFDLCLCLEVAEHLKPNRAEALIEFLCSLSDRVLFSAAIPNQGGTGHVNEMWQSYWYGLFKANGFGAAKVQPDIRNHSDIELWYRQNVVLYQRGAKLIVTDFVLPEYYMQITKYLKDANEKR